MNMEVDFYAFIPPTFTARKVPSMRKGFRNSKTLVRVLLNSFIHLKTNLLKSFSLFLCVVGMVLFLVASCGGGGGSGGGGTGSKSANPVVEDDPAQAESASKKCPDNFVALPLLDGYTSHGFCVAKYEMKLDTDSISSLASKATGTPIVNVSKSSAVNQCQLLGAGYDLITNDEWQTLARNIELVPGNWGGGTVGNVLGLSVGVSTGNPLVASEDDNEACAGIETCTVSPVTCLPLATASCSGTTWHLQRRTFRVSNENESENENESVEEDEKDREDGKDGGVIWDVAGNVWEWVKDDHKGDSGLGDSPGSLLVLGSGNSYSLFLGGKGGEARDSKGHFGASEDYPLLSSDPWGGLGHLWHGTTVGAAGPIYRGGSADAVATGKGRGLFSAELAQANDKGTYKGFRCVYRFRQISSGGSSAGKPVVQGDDSDEVEVALIVEVA